MSGEEGKPNRVTFFRITPQLKTFKEGTVLKTKIDLYYSTEEDIVETGGEDNWSPLAVLGGVLGGGQAGNPAGGTAIPPPSFSQSADFIHKEATVMFVEAAQFRASDSRIYVRAHLIFGEKVVWVNVLRIPHRRWSYMIREEQKTIIKDEIEKMFEVLLE